jgi:hypothetical protein
MSRSLRPEFEPLKLSPQGFHDSAADCAAAWERWGDGDYLASEIEYATQWLAGCNRTQRLTSYTSYGYKHEAEHWYGSYICNGALIMAAIRAGFKWRRCRDGSQNAVFNIGRDRPFWPAKLCPDLIVRCNAPKQILEHLARKWPGAFAEPRPLKIGIDRDLFPRVAVPDAQGMSRTLTWWVSRPEYLTACITGAVRVDLDGNPAGEVTEDDAAYAKRELEGKQ